MLDTINAEFPIVINGKKFMVKALSLGTIAKMSRDKRASDMLESANKMVANMPKETRDDFLLKVWQKIGQTLTMDEEMAYADKLFGTFEGINLVIKTAIKKTNPNVKDEEIEEDIDQHSTPSGLSHLVDICYKILALNADDADDADDESNDVEEAEVDLAEKKTD